MSRIIQMGLLLAAISMIPQVYAGSGSLPDPVLNWPPAPLSQTLDLNNSQAAGKLMQDRGYTLDSSRQSGSAPPLYALNLPADLAKQSVELKTRVFIRLLLPNIIKVNEDVLVLRHSVLQLQQLQKSGQDLSSSQQQWLGQVSRHYGLKTADMEALLERVDAVPVALALAQGIDESGWGTSHFARAGNVIYGQHAAAGTGQKTLTTPDGKVEVAAFNSLFQATASYIHNLNSTHAYHALRKLRSESRAADKAVTAHDLAGTLLHYSTRGEAYVQDLRGIIAHRHLENLDSLKIADVPAVAIKFPR